MIFSKQETLACYNNYIFRYNYCFVIKSNEYCKAFIESKYSKLINKSKYILLYVQIIDCLSIITRRLKISFHIYKILKYQHLYVRGRGGGGGGGEIIYCQRV